MWSAIPLKKTDFPSPGWKEMPITPWLGMRFHGYLLPYWDLSVLACTGPVLLQSPWIHTCICPVASGEHISLNPLPLTLAIFPTHLLHRSWTPRGGTVTRIPFGAGTTRLFSVHIEQLSIPVIRLLMLYLYFQRTLFSTRYFRSILYYGQCKGTRKGTQMSLSAVKLFSFHSIRMDSDSWLTFAMKGQGTEQHAPLHVPLLLEREWRVMTGMQKFSSTDHESYSLGIFLFTQPKNWVTEWSI